MSTKRYDTNPEKDLILEGLDFFVSSENPDLINPNEIKTLMDKLELKDKMTFIYNLISELCANKEIRRKGGLSKNDFIIYLENKLSKSESKEGIHTIYNVFTDSKDEILPMTNFCRTAREIGDMEKDEELKELLKESEMTGKELNFEEFNEIMKRDENNKTKKEEIKYQKQNINNRFAKKNKWKKEEKEDSEPSEERSSQKNKRNENENNINNNEEFESKNVYSYRRVKVEQTKKVISPKNEEPKEEPSEEKMITVEEIIKGKEVEVPNNSHVRYKYKFKNRFRREPKEEDNLDKEKTEENNEENNINNNDNSESKRYHRRYRPNNNINNEQKNDNINNNNITYNRYRRKAEN